VRFKFVQDVAALLLKLQKIWLGESKLLINVPRFGRDSFSGSRAPKVNRAGIGFDATVPHLSKSFAEAATGNLRTSIATDPPPELTLPPPPVRCLVVDSISDRSSFFSHCLIGSLGKNVKLQCFVDTLILAGFHAIVVRPLGGDLILLSSVE
ncbi:hypothetical protein A2U01_0052027, partial [Trifolium medium]|nr:hypothetical protein [Trifolium medium]